MSLLRTLVHRIAYRSRRSTTPTSVRALDTIRRALVVLDGYATDCKYVEQTAQDFFAGENINVEFFRFRGAAPGKKLPANEDLFISLVPDEPFEMKFAAARSKASFKVGRTSHKGFAYDLVLKNAQWKATQAEAFQTLKNLLKIAK